jgi:hypothetical protein
LGKNVLENLVSDLSRAFLKTKTIELPNFMWSKTIPKNPLYFSRLVQKAAQKYNYFLKNVYFFEKNNIAIHF